MWGILNTGILLAGIAGATSNSNNTVNNSKLQTWWHDSGEITISPVQPDSVRQSHLYSVQVSNSVDQTYYDSFTYQTIPRNGQGNILIPNDLTSTTTAGDGITIEAAIGMTMSWTSFLYSADVWVKVHRLDGFSIESDTFVIRPTNLNLTTSVAGGDLFIQVPYSERGSKFSVEFNDNLYDFRDGCSNPTCSYVQDTSASGPYYVDEYDDSMPLMGVEPLDSLLIFASPFEDESLIPDETSDDALVVPEGRISGLNTTEARIVIFKPGVYYATATDYLNLSSTVDWLYFAPGSYVKGAVEFHTTSALIQATGHGVLSGEQYVYQADPTYGFQNHNVDASPLRMWKGTVPNGQKTTWVVNGPTVNSPPFNSMDFYGDTSAFSVACTDYKQVGGYFGQTDGMQAYPGSVFQDIFYHTNDDTIKIYHSDVTVSNVVVQKGSTAPIIQFGWAARNISNIRVSDINIIHSRWNSNGSNPGIIGSNNLYDPSTASTSATNTSTADTYSSASNIVFSNIRSEGISGPLMRIYALENLHNITISNVWVEEFGSCDGYENIGISESFMPAMTDGNGDNITVEGFIIEDFMVGDKKVTLDTASTVGNLYWNPDFDVTIQ
ncbi:glycoside hydrolase [Aureobasidium pullulans]|uniref:Glycoside hydrolase n=1 Tax=Aureobasidium pullulans TaxID=5580 RepID=A0A4S9TEB7_AURPU|nr:glycoside hydrolase [Aureobasidium pullulans]